MSDEIKNQLQALKEEVQQLTRVIKGPQPALATRAVRVTSTMDIFARLRNAHAKEVKVDIDGINYALDHANDTVQPWTLIQLETCLQYLQHLRQIVYPPPARCWRACFHPSPPSPQTRLHQMGFSLTPIPRPSNITVIWAPGSRPAHPVWIYPHVLYTHFQKYLTTRRPPTDFMCH